MSVVCLSMHHFILCSWFLSIAGGLVVTRDEDAIKSIAGFTRDEGAIKSIAGGLVATSDEEAINATDATVGGPRSRVNLYGLNNYKPFGNFRCE